MDLEQLLRQAREIQSQVKRFERAVGKSNHRLNAQLSKHIRTLSQALELERKKQLAIQSLKGAASKESQ